MNRRSFLRTATVASAVAATGAAGVGAAFASAPAEFTLKLSNNLPEAHPMIVRLKEMAAKIGAESKGRINLQIYPNSQLGSDTDMLSQTRAGAVDFLLLSPLILGTLISPVQISNVGFAFNSYDKVWAAMDGDLGAHVRKQIASSSSLFAFEKIFDNGFRNVTSATRAIIKPEDLKGMKIRVMPSAMATSVFKSFDASPASINWAETYSALQTKIVDGQENPLAVIASNKIYEVQKFCSLTRHIWDGYWCLGNKKSFDRLPKDLQAIVQLNINAAALKQRGDLKKLNDSLVLDLKGKGLQVNETDRALFQAKLRSAGFYTEWHKKFGNDAWALLEKYAGTLS